MNNPVFWLGAVLAIPLGLWVGMKLATAAVKVQDSNPKTERGSGYCLFQAMLLLITAIAIFVAAWAFGNLEMMAALINGGAR